MTIFKALGKKWVVDRAVPWEVFLRIWISKRQLYPPFEIQIVGICWRWWRWKAYFNFPPFVERLPNHISPNSALKLGKCIYIFSQEAGWGEKKVTQLRRYFLVARLSWAERAKSDTDTKTESQRVEIFIQISEIEMGRGMRNEEWGKV